MALGLMVEFRYSPASGDGVWKPRSIPDVSIPLVSGALKSNTSSASPRPESMSCCSRSRYSWKYPWGSFIDSVVVKAPGTRPVCCL
jgi:hypothetical protein